MPKISSSPYVHPARVTFRIIKSCFVRICIQNCDFSLNVTIVMKHCSHVVCKVCTDSLIRPTKQCIVCDKTLDDRDIIELRREGAQPACCCIFVLLTRMFL